MMELEDQSWFPAFLRDQQTAFIGLVVDAFGIYKPILAPLKNLLATTLNKPWTDCCSGSAGPVLYLKKAGGFQSQILLTDKFPNQTISNNKTERIDYLQTPLDILQDKIPNDGLVTMFNAFHHFNMAERKQFVQQLITDKRPFLIAEILQPTFLDAVKIFITATVGQVLLAPFVKPFSVRRLFFTYLIPLNIITVLWDGIVSVIRAIRFSSLQKLAETFNDTMFEIKAVKVTTALAVVTYIIGKPITMDN